MKKSKHILNTIKTFFITKSHPRHYLGHSPKNLKEWLVRETPALSSIEPRITWIGQSTFLIQIGGINILTDPIFHTFSSLYPRFLPAGIAPQQLPKIDIVLLSHNHPDHMNKKSLLFLKKHNPVFLVPHGDGAWFTKRNFSNVIEHNWGDTHTTSTNISFTFLPAIHWSSRNLLDINNSLWGSWMIEHNKHKTYFAGDTAYDKSHFEQIKKDFPRIAITLMPIAPNKMRKIAKDSHTNAAEAGQAFLDLDATHLIPMHWGTFRINYDTFEEPIQLLDNWWKQNKDQLQNKQLHILKFGQAKQFEF